MAKQLGPKSRLIRQAILAHPDLTNKPLAELINGSDAREEDNLHVTPAEVAQQRQAMKKPGSQRVEVPLGVPEPVPAASDPEPEKPAPRRRGRKPGQKRAATPAEHRAVAAMQPSPAPA